MQNVDYPTSSWPQRQLPLYRLRLTCRNMRNPLRLPSYAKDITEELTQGAFRTSLDPGVLRVDLPLCFLTYSILWSYEYFSGECVECFAGIWFVTAKKGRNGGCP